MQLTIASHYALRLTGGTSMHPSWDPATRGCLHSTTQTAPCWSRGIAAQVCATSHCLAIRIPLSSPYPTNALPGMLRPGKPWSSCRNMPLLCCGQAPRLGVRLSWVLKYKCELWPAVPALNACLRREGQSRSMASQTLYCSAGMEGTGPAQQAGGAHQLRHTPA